MKTKLSIATLFFCVQVISLCSVLSQSYLDQFPLREQTKFFDFRYKQHGEKIKSIAKFADGFIQLVNRDFFKTDYDYPIRVLVFEDQATFKKTLREQFGILDPPNFGIFLYRYKLFATYEESGLGTFAHEIIHPLVERNLSERPIWAIEGIPTFFEKFYGYWDNDKLVVNWGYPNPWRIQMLGTDLLKLDLKQIISTTQTPGEYRESDRRQVVMFLWEQGKFKRFLELVQNNKKNGYDSFFEAAMGMPIDSIVPLWQKYLESVSAQRNEILRLPPSIILPDAVSYHKFAESNNIATVPNFRSDKNSP